MWVWTSHNCTRGNPAAPSQSLAATGGPDIWVPSKKPVSLEKVLSYPLVPRCPSAPDMVYRPVPLKPIIGCVSVRLRLEENSVPLSASYMRTAVLAPPLPKTTTSVAPSCIVPSGVDNQGFSPEVEPLSAVTTLLSWFG